MGHRVGFTAQGGRPMAEGCSHPCDLLPPKSQGIAFWVQG